MSDYGEGAPPPPPYGGGSQGGQYGQPQYGQPQQPPQYGQPQQPAYGAQPQQPQYGQPQQPAYGAQPYGAPPPAYGQPAYGQPAGASGAATPWGPIADAGQRALAYLLDLVIILVGEGVIYGVFFGLLFAVVGGVGSANADGTVSGAASGIAILLMGLLYIGMFALGFWYTVWNTAKKGGTFGKQIIGLKVINADTGANLSLGSAFLRPLVLGLTGSLCFIGYFSLLFDSSGRNQGWHDKAVGSLVIRTK